MPSALAKTREIVAELHREIGTTGRALVMVSGGKDSTAVLSMVREQIPAEQVAACFLYLVPGLRCVDTAINRQIKRFGIKDYIQLPHPLAAAALRYSIYRPQSAEVTSVYKHGDAERHALKLTGASFIVGGHRMVDSLERRGMIMEYGFINRKIQRCWPIAHWKHAEVAAYVRKLRLPLATRLGTSKNQSGIDLGDDVLIDLAKNFPDDFEKIIKVFPYAQAAIVRSQIEPLPEG